jgi:hypothetical protein
LCLAAASSAWGAGWWDGAWSFRRPVDVDWPADRATGDELAWTDLYTAGRHNADGSDVRVASEDGRLMASRVLHVGPGDKVRIVFALHKGLKRYDVYFGNARPAPPRPGTEDVQYRWGLLLETRKNPGAAANNFQQMEALWGRANEVVGRAMVDRLFLGINPFAEAQQGISRISGMLLAPVDGVYTFAGSCKEKGALYIDGKPLLFIPGGIADTRIRQDITLKRGRHEVTFYHQNTFGDGRFTVVWKRPDSDRFEMISPDHFGATYKVTVGPLEEKGKTFTSDFKAEYLGETYFNGHYAHRWRFVAWAPKVGIPQLARYAWELGDGQTAAGPSVEHVFLLDGEYTIRLTTHVGPNNDTQSTRFRVSRRFDILDKPPGDSIVEQSRVVRSYDRAKISARALPWAVSMHIRAQDFDDALASARRLAASTEDYDPPLVMDALIETTKALVARGRAADAVSPWENVPDAARIHPRAARYHAHLLMWLAPDFQRAVQVLEPWMKQNPDDTTRRVYAQALILAQRPAEGAKILSSLPIQGPADRQAAISGAMARSIEFYINDGDWETGEDLWERWQGQYPDDFLQGYSVLLRTRLMEAKKVPQAAAKVAEAFARAMPKSSYAPTLLHRASVLLTGTDPARSKELRLKLKQDYPEDPLSQDEAPSTRPTTSP